LVGDYVAGVNDLPQPTWRKEAIRLWSKWNRSQQDRVAKRSLTFVNSGKLYEELRPNVPNLIETHTTTLTTKDFFARDDTCLSSPVHLLYTGRINRAKGLLDIIEALGMLVAEGEEVVLDLIGWLDEGDITLEELYAVAERNGVADRVKYHGYKSVGPELFECYRQADLYVIASRSSFEGFPRTIWEAMAHSLPVVATHVGSIPHFTKGAAELIQPGDVNALRMSLSRLLHSPMMRQQMIQRGLELAHQNTLETQVSNMMAQIEGWVRRRP